MRLPNPILRRLSRQAARIIAERPPEFTVTDDGGQPYLQRWFVVRQGQRWSGLSCAEQLCVLDEDAAREDSTDRTAVNVFVHQFHSSDKDTVHDHPWRSLTVVLDGWYLEHTPLHWHDWAGPTRAVRRSAGDIVPRLNPAQPHRIEVLKPPVTTLFITGPKLREWGFWCHSGWVHWRQFIKRGCA